MKKRIISLLLVLLLAVSLSVPVYAAGGFVDVPSNMYYYNAVNWAVEKGITGGIGNNCFGPDNYCTRGQVVTFLWAAAGKPEPTSLDNPFNDVSESDFFFKPVLWAVEQGITGGVAPGQFGPANYCTRAQVATFLWAANGKGGTSFTSSPFSDVSSGDYFYNAVLWAVENGITGGIGNGMFGPHNTCTRGQIVMFLYAASDDYVAPEPVVPPVTAENRFEIACARVTDINSYDGVDIAIYWRNNTGRDLADIKFFVKVLDYNGNVLDCDIWDYQTVFECYITDPPFPSGQGSSYYTGTTTSGGKEIPRFTSLLYDEEFDANYYYNPDNYTEKIYVSPANAEHAYVATYWDAIMYNGRASKIQIDRVVLTYTDNTQETIWSPVVGPRTNPADDKIYTQQLMNSLGCDVVGHKEQPTCTESVVCSRCKETLPATGHTYKYSETCRNCGETFPSDIELKIGSLPAPIVLEDDMGDPYTFTVTKAGLDDYFDVDVSVKDGVPYIEFYLEVYYNYMGKNHSIFYDYQTVYVGLRNEEGEYVYNTSFTAYTSDQYKSFEAVVPESGTYYIDVTLSCGANGHDANPTCTESDDCSRCGQTFPATGHSYDEYAVCTVCGFAYEADVTIINTIIPGVMTDTPGCIEDVDAEGRAYSLYMSGIDVEGASEPVAAVEEGVPVVKMTVNVPFRYESEDGECEIPTYNVELDFYNSEGELVLSEFFNAYPNETNKSLDITLPGSDTYYVETHAEIFSAVA